METILTRGKFRITLEFYDEVRSLEINEGYVDEMLEKGFKFMANMFTVGDKYKVINTEDEKETK